MVFGLLERQVKIFAAAADSASGETLLSESNYLSTNGRVCKAGRF